VGAERRALQSLEQILAKEEADRIKASLILKQRKMFQESVDNRKLESCRYHLKELHQLGVDTDREERLFNQLNHQLSAEEELKHKMVAQTRERFAAAIEAQQGEQAEQFFNVLKEFNAPHEDESNALTQLRQKLERQERERAVKEKMVRQFRQRFEHALKRENPTTCRYYLEELRQLGADVTAEIGLLALLEKQ
jgi:uncharacterized protein YukE